MEKLEHRTGLVELSDLAERALALNKEGAQMEITLTNGFERSIEVKGNSISGVQQQTKTKVTVRIYDGKRLGIASATSLSPKSIEETVTNAMKLAKLSPPDDKFVSLPEPMERQPANLEGLYDSELAYLDPSKVVESIGDMIQGAREVHEKANVGGRLNMNLMERVVANSLGIFTQTENTSMSSFAFISIPLSPQNVGVGFEVNVDRKWDPAFSFHEFGKIAAEKAKQMLNAKIGPSKKLPALFDERATYQSLNQIFGFGVNGYSVMTGTSYFADKIGAELASHGLSLFDDPHVPGGAASVVFDREGVPTTRVQIMTDGVLESYVTDSYTANVLGLENTGNAGTGFRSKLPRPTIHQLQVEAGNDSREAMLEDLKEGILVESGVGPAGGSPQISAQINRGFYVKDGEIEYPLKNTMLGSNVYEFLGGIVAISRELRKEFGHQSPMILVKEVSIAGAGKQKKQGANISMSSF